MKNILAAVLLVFASLGVVAQTSTSGGVQGVISAQIEAFQVDDFETAFGYASPVIQRMFGTSENFGIMVRRGFPMVWRPAEMQFLGQRQQSGLTFQKLFVRDQDGAVHVLEYAMQMVGDSWQINGVQILKAPEVGA